MLHSWNLDLRCWKWWYLWNTKILFDIFVNQWCIKNGKNVFKLAFRLLLFPKFIKCWKLTHIKDSIFNITVKLKCRKLCVFWSNREIKMPRNTVFRLNREIQEIFKKTSKILCRENFLPWSIQNKVKIYRREG